MLQDGLHERMRALDAVRYMKPLPLAVGILALLTVANVAHRTSQKPPQHGKQLALDAPLRVNDEAGPALLPASSDPEPCHYIVIYDPECGACQVAAIQWSADILRNPIEETFAPEGWRFSWISLQDTLFPGDKLPSDTVVRHRPSAAPQDLVRRLGITSVPTTLIFAKNKGVVSIYPGAVLPRKEAFSAECKVDAFSG